ncbi:MAG: M16 family metallopeptidase [Gemmatimonadaceae bacterium]
MPKLPIVSVVALVDAGATHDPAGGEGLGVLTAKLLLEGTTTRDGATLADAFEQLGASVEVDASWDGVEVRLTVLADRLREALALLSDTLRHPGFRERDVARLKAERAAELLQIQADPRSLADESFSRLLYVASSRYGQPAGGNTRSVAAITGAEIATFYRTHYVPERLTAIVAGGVTHEKAEDLVSAAFAGWQGTPAKTRAPDDQVAERGRRIHIVTKEDAPQSELRIGHRGVARDHPDYFSLVVMNAILGGLFSSRINLNLREAHGYTYGARSGFEWRRGAGPFVISTAVESAVTADATREVVAEVTAIREKPVTEEELSLAKSFLEGVFPIRYETTAAIADALGTLVTYQLPEDYFDSYRPAIRNISAGDVLRVARTHLDPEQLLIVAVGDPEVIQASMARLDLAPITVDSPADYDTPA